MDNPYHETPSTQLQSGSDLFGNYRLIPTKSRETERGQLLKYFSQKLGKPIPYVAFKCTKLSIQDLYYMKSSADRYHNEGKGAWGKAWYGMLKLSTDEPFDLRV